MSVHSSTLQKLLRERFAPRAPSAEVAAIRLNDDVDVECFCKSLAERVAEKNLVTIIKPHGAAHGRGPLANRVVCDLEIREATTPSWRTDVRLSLELERATGTLHVRAAHDPRRPSLPVADLDQIAAFVADVHEAAARARVREAKREKLSKLRMHAVVARIRRIASEDGFAFATASEGNRVWLYVRLGAQSLLELRFSQQGFEASIEAARPLIAAARTCQDKRVAFGVRAGSTWRLRGLVWSDAKK